MRQMLNAGAPGGGRRVGDTTLAISALCAACAASEPASCALASFRSASTRPSCLTLASSSSRAAAATYMHSSVYHQPMALTICWRLRGQ